MLDPNDTIPPKLESAERIDRLIGVDVLRSP